MKRVIPAPLGVSLLLLLCASSAARAEVVRIEIAKRSDVLGGRAFGSVGSYEELVGRVYFAVDPLNPRNAVIVDLDKAPRNDQGKVEFSSDIRILAPKQPSNGNGVLLFDIVNRGRPTLGVFHHGTGSSPAATEFGDALLMREGYTLVAVGWELAREPGAIGLYPPIATENGQPIVGEISNWFIPTAASPVHDLTAGLWTGMKAYPPIDPKSPDARLTVRAGYFGEQTIVPRADWEFGRPLDGEVVYDPYYVHLKSGFQPGLTYELTYRTKDPKVAGLGFAAVRDLASAFKHDRAALVRGRYAYAYGSSQTGRYLRAFMHEGFTIDEDGRRAFDAVFANVAGASSGSFNERWAQPNEGGFFDQTGFPYRYGVEWDPVTGRMDGLGARIPEALQPKVILTNSATEYWGGGRVGALNHVTPDGLQDAREAENVRIYLMSGGRHGSGSIPAGDAGGQLLSNPLDYGPAMRALLVALDRWVRYGEAPPPSRHPRLADGTLVVQKNIRFPAVRGVQWPYEVPGGYRSDLPGPLAGNPLPHLVPQVDDDGNETGGVRVPEQSVPLATYTGWAFRSERLGATDQILPLAGSYIPFARTRAEREAAGDPRLSIVERYPDRADYLRRVGEITRTLVRERYLLQEDVDRIIERAGRHWDLLMETAPADGAR